MPLQLSHPGVFALRSLLIPPLPVPAAVLMPAALASSLPPCDCGPVPRLRQQPTRSVQRTQRPHHRKMQGRWLSPARRQQAIAPQHAVACGRRLSAGLSLRLLQKLKLLLP